MYVCVYIYSDLVRSYFLALYPCFRVYSCILMNLKCFGIDLATLYKVSPWCFLEIVNKIFDAMLLGVWVPFAEKWFLFMHCGAQIWLYRLGKPMFSCSVPVFSVYSCVLMHLKCVRIVLVTLYKVSFR